MICLCSRCISKDHIAVLGVCTRLSWIVGKGLPLLSIYATLLFYSNLEFPNSTNEWPFLTSQLYFQDKEKTSKTVSTLPHSHPQERSRFQPLCRRVKLPSVMLQSNML